MKSGLEGRNNLYSPRKRTKAAKYLNEVRPRRPEQLLHPRAPLRRRDSISMKSGLEGRNNWVCPKIMGKAMIISMKSGLEGRNNGGWVRGRRPRMSNLNEVRPRRPEQYAGVGGEVREDAAISMKSGLEGRNNPGGWGIRRTRLSPYLNEVRPRRPEQCAADKADEGWRGNLNEVRPRRPEQSVAKASAWSSMLSSQ